jgi:hypothetical protein
VRHDLMKSKKFKKQACNIKKSLQRYKRFKIYHNVFFKKTCNAGIKAQHSKKVSTTQSLSEYTIMDFKTGVSTKTFKYSWLYIKIPKIMFFYTEKIAKF